MPAKQFLPLDLSFMEDEKIIDAGPEAAWLFLAMLLAAKRIGSDGILSYQQIGRLNVNKYPKLLEKLCATGLVLDVSESENAREKLWIPSWSKWNISKKEREEKRAKAQSAAQKRWGTDAKRNANRNAVSIEGAYAREEKRREEKRNTNPETVDKLLNDLIKDIQITESESI